jgi:hypothetical protein
VRRDGEEEAGWIRERACVRTCVQEGAVEVEDHGGDLVRRCHAGLVLWFLVKARERGAEWMGRERGAGARGILSA